MGVRLGQELYAAQAGQFAEAVDHLRGIDLHLLEGSTGDGEGNLEFPAALADHFHDGTVSRQVALFGDAVKDLFVLEIVVVVMVVTDVEEAVAP